jgi:type I restriction enzyme, S subunit
MKSTAPRETRTTRSTGDLIAEGKLTIGDGYRAKNSELSTSGPPFARAGNIDGGFHFEDADRFPEEDLGKVGDKASQPGDVVFTSKGTVGRLAFVRATTPRFVYSPQLCYWRTLDPEVIDDRWLYYWMCGPDFGRQVSGLKGQTDMADYVSLTDQRRMEISLPPVAVQRAVAGVLGALDDKIEQNRRTALTLERLSRAIFRAWFVEFEPIKAKAEGATSFPTMSQQVFDALPTRFVDSEIGPVPEGWEVKALSGVCTLVSGGTPKRSEATYWGGDVPWYSVKDAPSDGDIWAIKTSERITEKGVANSAARVVPKGCTIISARGTVGKLAMAGIPMAFNQSCYGLMPGDGRSFCYLHLLMQTAVADLQQRTHGSVFDTITRSTFDGLLVALPPSEAVMSFESVVGSLFDLLLASLQESWKLAEVRDYLLPKLLSGQVRVGAAHG